MLRNLLDQSHFQVSGCQSATTLIANIGDKDPIFDPAIKENNKAEWNSAFQSQIDSLFQKLYTDTNAKNYIRTKFEKLQEFSSKKNCF